VVVAGWYNIYKAISFITAAFFRIKAENLAGVSPLVESSEPVMLNRTKCKTAMLCN
jgi:hypothetical protein